VGIMREFGGDAMVDSTPYSTSTSSSAAASSGQASSAPILVEREPTWAARGVTWYHSTGNAEARFHRVHDLFDRRHVGTVAIEDFVAERDTFPGDNPRDADLLAVRTMVATMAALGQS
ncbi:MAG: hypothetical protein JW940_30050, partial [Polyangiaceae bacterium]|nr:hypothetical protein [Polyangiaceae bacterium]